jgi:hypothetical protein
MTDLQPQVSLYETTIENAELEAALEELQETKEKLRPLNKQKKDGAAAAKLLVEALDLSDGPVRVGRFVIALKPTAARHVEFDADPGERLVIKLLEDMA